MRDECKGSGRMLIIGIAGGTGSGKTTITRHLAAKFGADAAVICHDWYYRRRDGESFEERARQNYDCPEAFETELLTEQLAALRAGCAVNAPSYDYTVHNRSSEVHHIEPSPVLLLEGILILENAALRDMMDIKIFVDTDADVRILRRILRDVNERARSLESVVEQYLGTVKPMHEMYVAPSRKYADIIVPEGGHNAVALDMITDRVARHLAEIKGKETVSDV